MKCIIVDKKSYSVARFSSSVTKNVPSLIRSIVHAEFNGRRPKVILDAEELDDSGSMTTQLAIITAFKKEVDLMNGSLKICSLRPRIKNYMLNNGLDRIFDIYEDLNSAETSPWERKEYGEQKLDTGTAA